MSRGTLEADAKTNYGWVNPRTPPTNVSTVTSSTTDNQLTLTPLFREILAELKTKTL